MKQHFDLIIKGGKVLAPHLKNPCELVEEETDIGVSEGKITELGQLNPQKAGQVFDAKNLHILPGLIDSQVHFREPGMEHKEDLSTGSQSALLGGMSAFLEMPNTYPPTTSETLLKDKLKRAKNRSWCDFAFFAGASPENITHLPHLEHHKHCCGIKVFMGSSTGSLLVHKEEQLNYVFHTTRGPLAFHSEDNQRLQKRKKLLPLRSVREHTEWRDSLCALLSTQKLVGLAQKFQRRIHILHLSTAEEIEFLSPYKNLISVELTPQHLSLASPDCYEQLGTLSQMNPPLRSKNHLKALWRGLHSGLVTMLGSDHAPHLLKEKQQKYPGSPAGMPGTQTMLPLMLDHVNKKRLSLKHLCSLLSSGPCRYYQIKDQGFIRKGFKAHFTVVDLKKTERIRKAWLASRCGWSPFENKQVQGWPVGVMLKGKWAMREGQLTGPPKGEALCFNKSFSHNSL